MPTAVLFRCPETGTNVQGWLESAFEHGRETYEAVDCTDCGGVHLVNPPTGKTLDEKDQAAR